jgi:hypothetical protein
VKTGGKQNNRFVEISDYVINRRDMEDSKPVPIGSHSQPREPIGDTNRVTSEVTEIEIEHGG